MCCSRLSQKSTLAFRAFLVPGANFPSSYSWTASRSPLADLVLRANLRSEPRVYAFLPGARGLTGLTSQLCLLIFLSQDFLTPLSFDGFFAGSFLLTGVDGKHKEGEVEHEGSEEEVVERDDAVEGVAEEGEDAEAKVGKALFLVLVGGMPIRYLMRESFWRSALPLIPCMTSSARRPKEGKEQNGYG